MPEVDEGLLLLAKHAQLEQLTMDELYARRSEPRSEPVGDLEPEPPKFAMRWQRSTDAENPGLRISLRCDLTSEDGSIVVEPVGVFRVPAEDAELLSDDARVLAFINEVAVMTLLPFIRQAVADMSLRVFEQTILMPVMPRGAVRFEAPSSQPAD